MSKIGKSHFSTSFVSVTTALISPIKISSNIFILHKNFRLRSQRFCSLTWFIGIWKGQKAAIAFDIFQKLQLKLPHHYCLSAFSTISIKTYCFWWTAQFKSFEFSPSNRSVDSPTMPKMVLILMVSILKLILIHNSRIGFLHQGRNWKFSTIRAQFF